MKTICRTWGVMVPVLLFVLLSCFAAAQQNGQMGAADPTMLAAAPAEQTDVSVESASFLGNVDYIAAGTSLRNLGSGTIRLRGAPPTATVEFAVLYFGIICSSPAACPLTQTVTFNGTPVTAIQIATAPQPCWTGGPYALYSTDVTPLINPGINDDYLLADVPSGTKDGSHPFSAVVLPLAEGASVIVVISDPGFPPGVVYINDGAVMFFFGVTNIDNPLSPPLIGNSRHLTIIGADGQTFDNPDLSGEKTFIGPGMTAGTQIGGPGSSQIVDSDWNGHDGVGLQELWDTNQHRFNGVLPAGATSYRTQFQAFGDCIVWDVNVLAAH